jgi:hypothetical protein
MSGPSTTMKPMAPRRTRLLLRVLSFLVLATCIGWTLNQAGRLLDQKGKQAGFSMGVIQGALMPLALPNLAVGHDVTIYSANNTGRSYKLGYTMGVNVCGLIFFGIFFWRVSRWRRSEITAAAQTPSGS